MNNSDLPEPFRSARRIAGIHVELTPADLTRERPDVSLEMAGWLMEQNGEEVATLMLTAGLEALVRIVQQHMKGKA
jgi:hypothetical protein